MPEFTITTDNNGIVSTTQLTSGESVLTNNNSYKWMLSSLENLKEGSFNTNTGNGSSNSFRQMNYLSDYSYPFFFVENPLIEGEELIYADGYSVIRYNKTDDNNVWEYQLDPTESNSSKRFGSMGSLFEHNGNLYTYTEGSNLGDGVSIVSLDIATGEERWEETIPGYQYSLGCLINGTLYVGSSEQCIALDVTQTPPGTEWTSANPGDISMTMIENDLIAMNDNGGLLRMNKDDGSVLWTSAVTLTDPLFGSIPVYDGNNIYTRGFSNGRTVYKIDLSNGDQIWSKNIDTSLPNPSISAGTRGLIWTDDRMIEVAGEYVMELDPNNGDILWNVHVDLSSDVTLAEAAVKDGILIVGGFHHPQGDVIAVDLENQSLIGNVGNTGYTSIANSMWVRGADYMISERPGKYEDATNSV